MAVASTPVEAKIFSGSQATVLWQENSPDNWATHLLKSGDVITLSDSTVTKPMLVAFFNAVEMLRTDPQGKKKRTKLAFTKCNIEKEACEMLKGKLPLLLTNVSLKQW